MSISYEEALATLQAMFGEPWTRSTLDAVLRHEKGHMENTCELILAHGDADPQILVDRLKNNGPEPQVALDEELARQLAAQQPGGGHRGGGGRGGPSSSPATKKKGRGTPTTLPDDFLRIPGYKRSVASVVAAGGGSAAAIMDDETLARMLQDELFAEELARNPDFAHLARGGRARRGRAGAGAATTARASSAGGSQAPNPFEGLNVMQAISGMGEGARRRLQNLAANFEQKINNINSNNNAAAGGTPHRSGSVLQEAGGAAAERRGLLDGDGDDDEDMIEFETRKKQE